MNDKQLALELLQKKHDNLIEDAKTAVKNYFDESDVIYAIYRYDLLVKDSYFNPNQALGKVARENYNLAHRDAIRYAIQLLVKFASSVNQRTPKKTFLIKKGLFDELITACLQVNHSHEQIYMIEGAKDVELLKGEKIQAKTYLDETLLDPLFGGFMKYGARLQAEVNAENFETLVEEDLYDFFRKVYLPNEDLFIRTTGVNINDYIGMVKTVLNEFKTRVKARIYKNKFISRDFIDTNDVKTYKNWEPCYVFSKDYIESLLSEEQIAAFRKLILHKADIDESEMMFFVLSRKPIIVNSKSYIISPTLLLESMITNQHYSILEYSGDDRVKHDYKNRESNRFLDKIVSVFEARGYREVQELRNYDIMIGKKNLGDVDIVFENLTTGEFLFVEAKNETLPLEALSLRIEGLRRRLAYTQNWSNKVRARLEYLTRNPILPIGLNFRYIIVSKVPEVLSHFEDDLIAISLKELDFFLSLASPPRSFSEFYELYSDVDASLPLEELERMRRIIMPGSRFAIE